MGADMLIATLAIDEDLHPDFAAAHRAVDVITADRVEDPDEFLDLPDLATPEGLVALRADLHRCLDELERRLGGREFTWIPVRGANVYVTGGPSWGDSPTEAFDLIDRLRAVRGVLAAAEFEDELP
jgi:hypothetical protein